MRNAISVATTLLCCATIASTQTPAQAPAFEVATVKPSDRNSAPMSMQRLPGGRFVTSNTPLTMLINWAFNLDDGRLLGAPKGAESARFDIVAKSAVENPAAGQMQLMMRTHTGPSTWRPTSGGP